VILNLILEIVQSLIYTDSHLLLPMVMLSFHGETAFTSSEDVQKIILMHNWPVSVFRASLGTCKVHTHSAIIVYDVINGVLCCML